MGKHYFDTYVKDSAGILEAYKELRKDGDAEKFAESYSDYVNLPSILRLRDPQMYGFMRDRVFYGKEYKYETKSNAFGMNFSMSLAEGRELRKMAMQETNGGRSVSGNPLSNKLNYAPEDNPYGRKESGIKGTKLT